MLTEKLNWTDVIIYVVERFPQIYTEIFIKKFCKEAPKQEQNIANKNNIPTILIRLLSYVGNKGEHLKKLYQKGKMQLYHWHQICSFM